MLKSVLEVPHKPKKTSTGWFSGLQKALWRYLSTQRRWCLLHITACVSFPRACPPCREGNSALWCPWLASQPYTFHSEVTAQLRWTEDQLCLFVVFFFRSPKTGCSTLWFRATHASASSPALCGNHSWVLPSSSHGR